MKKNLYLGLLVIFLVFSFIGCGDEDSIIPDNIPKELQGIWIGSTILSAEMMATLTFTFSKDSIISEFQVNENLWAPATFNILSFSIINNENNDTKEEFPTGYKLSGIVSIKGDSIYIEGDNYFLTVFLDNTKNKFIDDSNDLMEFEKQ